MRARRRQLPRWKRARAAFSLAAFVMRQRWYVRSRRIAVYFANDGEIDPAPLLQRALAAGKRVFLPRIRGRHLQFIAYSRERICRSNRFAIRESQGLKITPHKLDVVFVPLVGFDRRGGRLGMGGGFYDRTFARRPNAGRPLLIGLGYAFQELSAVPHEHWDVVLNGIVTERECIGVSA